MKKIIFASILTMLFFSCQKEKIKIPMSDIFNIESTYTEQVYEIKVLLPDNYDSSIEYPAVYLLDGYYHFNDVSAVIDKNSQMRDFILVGIFYEGLPFSFGNINAIEKLREVDLTYPKHQEEGEAEIGGGALLFHEFLEQELITLIDEKYSTDSSDRTLLGHSLGGYYTLFELFEFQSQTLFKHLVALSPSLWWSDLHIFKIEEEAFMDDAILPFNLHLGVAEQEGIEANVLIQELEERLDNHNHQQLIHETITYGGGHLASAITGFELALKDIFE